MAEKLKQRIIISIFLILLSIPGTYIVESISREHNLNSGAVIKIQNKKDNTLISLMGVDIIKSLMAQEFPGDEEAGGTSLLYVVGSAGLGAFEEVEIKGLNGEKTFVLHKKDIDKNYMLIFTDQGTVSLYNMQEPDQALVENVSEINKIK